MRHRRRVGLLEGVVVVLVGTLGACVLVLALIGWLVGMFALGLVKAGRAVRRG